MTQQEFNAQLNSIQTLAEAIRHEAHMAHEQVNQHYDGHPYGFHLDMVSDMVRQYGYEVLQSADEVLPVLFGAYFHDSIEDARLSYNDVMKVAMRFMSDKQAYMATEIVYALTNEKGRTRAERANEKYYMGIRTTPFAPMVKLSDRMANMSYSLMGNSSMLPKYQAEMPKFLKAIDAGTGSDVRFMLPTRMLQAVKAMIEDYSPDAQRDSIR